MSQKFYIGVGAMLIKNNQILLLERASHLYRGGLYCLPGGHVESDESVRQTLARELVEEVGIIINPKDAQFVYVCHHKQDREYLYFVFSVDTWQGQPINKEPDKHSTMSWFDLDKVPHNMLFDINLNSVYRNKIMYSEYGWI